METRDGRVLTVGTPEFDAFVEERKAGLVRFPKPVDPDLQAAHDALNAHPDYPRLSAMDQLKAHVLVARRFDDPSYDPASEPHLWEARLKTDEEMDAATWAAAQAAVVEEAKRDPTSPSWEAVAGEAIDAADLLKRTIAPMRYAVADVLPEGLGVLAAPPKAGKSMLAYQLAVELTLGQNVLGKRVEQRPVLYYALEDGERRSQSRILGALGHRTLPRGLSLRWDAPALGDGLEDEVDAYLDRNPLGVVIIDVLAKVRPAGGKTSLNAYDADYQTLKAMHGVAKAHPGSVILFVTHDRKAGSEDFVTRITGTRGVSGAADFCIFINRERGAPIGTIVATGRDLEDLSIPVRFNGTGWEPAVMSDIIEHVSETRQAIFRHVAQAGPVWQKVIADATGLTETVVYNRVRDMAKDGQLVSTKDGYIVGEVEP